MSFPSPATDYIESDLNLHDLIVQKPAATFFMRAKDDSMICAGIYPEDILVIDRSITAMKGHVIVAALNGEFILRRLTYDRQTPLLIAENKNYSLLRIQPEDDFQIFGVLTCSLHRHL